MVLSEIVRQEFDDLHAEKVAMCIAGVFVVKKMWRKDFNYNGIFRERLTNPVSVRKNTKRHGIKYRCFISIMKEEPIQTLRFML